VPQSVQPQFDITPSARRLTSSLRDVGYDFVAALADLVDNCVTAQATQVDIEIVFKGAGSYILIADNGSGMTETELTEALRFGTRRDYERGDLGRYGLGLKTASISQCRRVSVVTRRALTRRRIAAKTLDIDHIQGTDRWEIIDPPARSMSCRSLEWLGNGPGTVITWELLDRVLPENRPDGGWARRRLESLARRSADYLGMVFHRFIEGTADRDEPLVITVNGEKVVPWNPFAPLEEQRQEMPAQSFEVAVGGLYGRVRMHRYILPPRERFSSIDEFERLSGPEKWNRQQGLYIYRADRLIQHGGWCGIRAADEHTKLARASIDFQTDLDELFQINVAKMRAVLPAEVRGLIERPVHELCHRADALYRSDSAERTSRRKRNDEVQPRRDIDLSDAAATLAAAALDAGEHRAFMRIMERVKDLDPGLAVSLGW
jgi:hypothetical protein